MSDSLEARILQEIHKTGFPLELRVSDCLNSRGYYVANNLYYVDQDEQKGREADIRALYNQFFKVQNTDHCARNCILIECKKSSDKPWVIFTSPEASYDPSIFDVETRGLLIDPNWSDANFSEALEKIHPFYKYKRRGRSYFEAFKNTEAGDTIFKALTTAVKATISMRDGKFGAQVRDLCFYYPLIVFEGKLFEAYLEDGKITVSESEAIMVTFSYQSASYKSESFIVPIVTEKALTQICTGLEESLACWANYLMKHPTTFKQVDRISFK